MRVAQYLLPDPQDKMTGGELALFFFGAGVGGDTQANLARWAQQFRQADEGDPMANALINSFTTESGLKVTTIELTGTYQPGTMSSAPSFDHPGWALFGAVVEGEGGPWFFKAVGPEAVMEHHHDRLLSLYEGIRPSGS
jgi:hypothetical protein